MFKTGFPYFFPILLPIRPADRMNTGGGGEIRTLAIPIYGTFWHVGEHS